MSSPSNASVSRSNSQSISKQEHLLTTLPANEDIGFCKRLTTCTLTKSNWLAIVILSALISAGIILAVLFTGPLRKDDNDNNHSMSKSIFMIAAVQYYPYGMSVSYPSSSEVLRQNLQAYGNAIEEVYNVSRASVANMSDVAMIAVFPEAGLGYLVAEELGGRDAMLRFCEEVPNPNEHVIPCNNPVYASSQQLRNLSCFAMQYNMTLVINMCDVIYCNNTSLPCPSDGRLQYDTNVAFDSNGMVISKYAKSHIYDEELFNEPAVPATEVFAIKELNNLPIGTLVCFDIEYHSPITALVPLSKYLAFTSWWASNQPPMLTAPMIQQSVSYIHKITVIAANALSTFAPGGGIFASGEILSLYWNSTYITTPGDTVVKVARVNMSEASTTPNSANIHDAHEQTIDQHISSLNSLISHTSSTPLSTNSTFPCVIKSIALPGKCMFVESRNGMQTFDVTHNNVRCLANVTFDLSSGYDNISNYAIFATDFPYDVPSTTDILTMNACFLLRCESGVIDPNQPLKCDTNVYKADAIVRDVDIYGSYNCSEFWEPMADGMPMGQVLPMAAVDDAQPIHSSMLSFNELGCQNLTNNHHDISMSTSCSNQCWWRLQVLNPITQPIWSVGMYGINGRSGE